MDANKTVEEIVVRKKCGWVKTAFCFAFHYLKNEVGFEEALSDMLIRGGDTDTNACIVGGLLGAHCGYSNLPAHIVESFIDK